MPPVSDELLIDAVHRGDSQAWQQLIDRYEGRLLAFVGGRGPDLDRHQFPGAGPDE